MTVEFQWVDVESGVVPPSYAIPIISEIGDLIGYRILQYREDPIAKYYGIRGKPTAWVDVPLGMTQQQEPTK